MIDSRLQDLVKAKSLIIFDFDQTLVWLRAPWGKYVENIINKYGDKLDDFPFNIYEANVIDLWNFILKKSKSHINEFRKMNEEFEDTSIESIEYNPDLINYVKELSQKKTLFIWSGNSSRIIYRVLKDLKIFDCFNKIVTTNETVFLKPETDGFKLIYDKSNKLSEYLLIGDSKYDYEAAKNANIDFFAIDYFKSFAAAKSSN